MKQKIKDPFVNIQIRIDRESGEKFHILCIKTNTTMTAVVNEYIKKLLSLNNMT